MEMEEASVGPRAQRGGRGELVEHRGLLGQGNSPVTVWWRMHGIVSGTTQRTVNEEE